MAEVDAEGWACGNRRGGMYYVRARVVNNPTSQTHDDEMSVLRN